MARMYYDIVLWEDVDDNDTEKLKNKGQEMMKRFAGYGVLSFNMRAAPVTQAQLQAQQEAAAQAQAQQAAQAQVAEVAEEPLAEEEEFVEEE